MLSGTHMPDTLVVGGGNAGLCSAIELALKGIDVTILESAPEFYRGGNSKYTRDIRYAHDEDKFTSGVYTEEELLSDLVSVSGELPDPEMARDVIKMSRKMPYWMEANGIVFKKEIRGTLDLSRTNAFFLGGGKSLMNTYYERARSLGVKIAYNAQVTDIKINGNRFESVTATMPDGKRQIRAQNLIVCSGGFEANKEWLSEIWGDSSRNFKIRGTRYNTGIPLKSLIKNGARSVGDPKGGHMIAVDQRAPEFDGGIVTRIDAIPKGIALNIRCERFYDEGEDIWPKRYAIWGKLLAEQEQQTAFAITDSRTYSSFMPSAYPPVVSDSLDELAKRLGLPSDKLVARIKEYNSHVICNDTSPDHFRCYTSGLTPEKSHFATTIDSPPFYGYPLRPGLTFTYMGVRIDHRGRVMLADGPAENMYAAGEIASGNVLKSGYLAGFGLTIGTTLGWKAAEGIINAGKQ